MFLWFADASSVAYLDLSSPEFHRKYQATLVSALDLCPTPRIRSDMIVPNIKLVQVFGDSASGQRFRTVIRTNLMVGNFFSDYDRTVFEKLTMKWDMEIMLLYLKQARTYSNYIKQSLYAMSPSENDSEYKVLVHEKGQQTLLQDLFMLLADKFMKIISDNVPLNSEIISDYFQTVCTSSHAQARIFFQTLPDTSRLLLSHLKKQDCNFVDTWNKEIISTWNIQYLLRFAPEKLLILLNNGFKGIMKKQTQFPYSHPNSVWINEEEFYWRMLSKEEQQQETLRESIIHETFRLFTSPSQSNLEMYLQCLRIYWRSVPDSCISYEEARSALFKYLDARAVEYVCDDFQNCGYDGFETIPQPRSLKHHCRCVIRNTLINNSKMPEGISNLRLPPILQSFLRLET